jgi:Tol biopolymer transport system component
MRQILFLFGLMTVLIGGLLLLARRSESRAYWLTYDSAAPVVIHRRLPDGSIYNMKPGRVANPEQWDWSPDGRWLLFSASRDGARHLFRLRVDSTILQQITDLPGWPLNAQYSPNGKWIVFAAGERLTWGLYLVPAEGGEVQRLSRDIPLPPVPVWSPNGEWIAFAGYDDLRWSIYRMRPDGSELEQIYLSQFLGNASTPTKPLWSPDGAWIIFSDGTSPVHIYRMRPDGSSLQALTEGTSHNHQPVFADGNLYFSSDRNGVFNIFCLNLNDDAPPQAITSSADDLFIQNVSPDGAWLHILREEFSSGSGPFGDYRLISTDGSRSQRIRAATSPDFRPTVWSPLIDLPFRVWVVVAVGGVMMIIAAVASKPRDKWPMQSTR